jgi:hypothetical protein
MLVEETLVAVILAVPIAVEAERFVEETLVAVILAVSMAVEAVRLVEDTLVAVIFAVSMEVPTVIRVEERFTARRFVPVAFTKVMPVEEAVLKMPPFVTERLPIPRLPEPVAFVKVIPCRVVGPTTCSVDDGCDVPIPREESASSQNKSGVLETVDVASQ